MTTQAAPPKPAEPSLWARIWAAVKPYLPTVSIAVISAALGAGGLAGATVLKKAAAPPQVAATPIVMCDVEPVAKEIRTWREQTNRWMANGGKWQTTVKPAEAKKAEPAGSAPAGILSWIK